MPSTSTMIPKLRIPSLSPELGPALLEEGGGALLLSADSKVMAWAVDSKTSPAPSGICDEALRAVLASRTASGPSARMRSAMRRAAARSSAAGTTSLTRPWRSAWAASHRAPVRIISFARPRPTTRGSRWVPPAPGNDAQRRLGKAEDGVLRGDAEVAGQGQLAAPAEGHAVDGRDGHRLVGLHRGHEPRVDRGEGVVAPALADGRDVGARHEGLVSGPGHDQHRGLRAPHLFEGDGASRPPSRRRGRSVSGGGSRSGWRRGPSTSSSRFRKATYCPS